MNSFYQSPPHKILPPTNKGTKQVRFSKPIFFNLESFEPKQETLENFESHLGEVDMRLKTDEFNIISEHELLVEQQTDKIGRSQGEKRPSKGRDIWPALFGDTSSIWKAVKKEERNEEKVMCFSFYIFTHAKEVLKDLIVRISIRLLHHTSRCLLLLSHRDSTGLAYSSS